MVEKKKRMDFFSRLTKMQRVKYFLTFLGRRFNQRRVSNRVTLQSVLRESKRNMRYTLDLHR